MKKYLFPVLLALLAAVSCQREKQIDPNGAVEITVTATSDTRTYIENDGTAWIPYWNTGDVLGVMVDDNYGDPVSLTNTAEPGRTGTFSGTLREGVTDGEHTLTAWYPKDLRVGRSESVLKYVLAEEQALPSLTSFDPAMDLLVGLPETFVVADRKANVDNMRFRRVFTVVKVTLKDESTLLAGKKVSRVALTATGANLAGKAHVEITTGDITRWENPSATVAGNYAGDDFTIDGTNSVFLLVNPAPLDYQEREPSERGRFPRKHGDHAEFHADGRQRDGHVRRHRVHLGFLHGGMAGGLGRPGPYGLPG